MVWSINKEQVQSRKQDTWSCKKLEETEPYAVASTVEYQKQSSLISCKRRSCTPHVYIFLGKPNSASTWIVKTMIIVLVMLTQTCMHTYICLNWNQEVVRILTDEFAATKMKKSRKQLRYFSRGCRERKREDENWRRESVWVMELLVLPFPFFYGLLLFSFKNNHNSRVLLLIYTPIYHQYLLLVVYPTSKSIGRLYTIII